MRHRRVLVDPDAAGDRGVSEALRERSGVDERGAGALQDGAEVGRGVDLGARGVAVEHLGLPAVAAQQRRLLRELLDLVRARGDAEHPGLLPLRVDAQAVDVRPHPVQVLPPQRLEQVQLLREARGAVRQPVRQRGLDEPAVAPARALPGHAGLEQHHLPVGPLLLRLHRGPQPGEPATDDREVRLDQALERRRRRRQRPVQPVRHVRGVAQGFHAASLREGANSSRDDLTAIWAVNSTSISESPRSRALRAGL